MEDNLLKVRFTVENMQVQILRAFDGYEKVLEEAVKSSLTPENILAEVEKQIHNSLGIKISWALEKIVNEKIKKSKKLQDKVDAIVAKALKSL